MTLISSTVRCWCRRCVGAAVALYLGHWAVKVLILVWVWAVIW